MTDLLKELTDLQGLYANWQKLRDDWVNFRGSEEAYMIARDSFTNAMGRRFPALLELARDGVRYRLLRQYTVDSYIAVGSGESLDRQLDERAIKHQPKIDVATQGDKK